jgi:choice-of-anchor A domain-containing protein
VKKIKFSYFTESTFTVATVLATAIVGTTLPAQSASLGIASNYNAFIFESMTQQNADAEGRVAVGGNATLTNFGIADRLPNSSGTDARLVVGGNLNYNGGQVFGGNGVHGGTATVANVGIPNGSFAQGNPIDFTTAVQELTNLSTQLASLSATDSVTYYNWGGIELKSSGSGLTVFNVDGAKLSSTNYLKIETDANATVVINVSGSNVSLQNFGTNLFNTSKQNILYNFYEATQLSSSSFSFQGSVLAPKADYNFTNGNLEGTLIAKSVSGNGEYHNYQFQGNLPSFETEIVPEPTNIAGILLTGTGFTLLRRRK